MSFRLVHSFFVRGDRRRTGITLKLLAAAVSLAKEHGATAVEGFPLSRAKHSSQDPQVGSESVFAALGFRVIPSPSTGRVVMRLELTG